MKQPPKNKPTNGPCPFCEQYPCECETEPDENVYDDKSKTAVKEPKPRKRKGKSQ